MKSILTKCLHWFVFVSAKRTFTPQKLCTWLGEEGHIFGFLKRICTTWYEHFKHIFYKYSVILYCCLMFNLFKTEKEEKELSKVSKLFLKASHYLRFKLNWFQLNSMTWPYIGFSDLVLLYVRLLLVFFFIFIFLCWHGSFSFEWRHNL